MRLLSFLILLLAACSNSGKASLPEKTTTQKIPPSLPLLKGGENSKIRLGGQVVSPGKMMLAFQTTGTISKLIAKPGMFFKKDQVLAELDPRDIALRTQAAKLRYEQALNAQKIAERDYKIEQELHAQGIGSQVQFENIQLNAENAKLNAKMADTDYKTAAKALGECQLRAPFDCVVTQQLKNLGDSSSSGATYEIYETSAPEIRLQAPEGLLGQIKIGSEIDIKIPALKETFAGKIIRFVPIISEQTRTFLIVAQLKQANPKVVPGYFAEGILK